MTKTVCNSHLVQQDTIGGVLGSAEQQIRSAGVIDSPRLDAETLLVHVTGRSRAWVIANRNVSITANENENYVSLINSRCEGRPVAYLTGCKEFWSIMLEVNESVLIPRPETELVVERALRHMNQRKRRVLDLGTGSGAISLAIAMERPDCEILATDVSASAIAVARRNANRHEVENIAFAQGSWYEPVVHERFDLIVSNPPYIVPGDTNLNSEIRYEPRRALVAARNGLCDLEQIIASAPNYLTNNGSLIVEHGCHQAVAVRAIFGQAGFSGIATYQDLAGLDRVTCGVM